MSKDQLDWDSFYTSWMKLCFTITQASLRLNFTSTSCKYILQPLVYYFLPSISFNHWFTSWLVLSVGESPGKFVDERMDRLHQIIQLSLYHYFRGILKSPVSVLLYLISSYLLAIIFKQFDVSTCRDTLRFRQLQRQRSASKTTSSLFAGGLSRWEEADFQIHRPGSMVISDLGLFYEHDMNMYEWNYRYIKPKWPSCFEGFDPRKGRSTPQK